uniref:Putative secreted protein n=1 Tax=Anopheles marajoara TaxID=58244 RepID=A0A2M4CBT5_9DIPT
MMVLMPSFIQLQLALAKGIHLISSPNKRLRLLPLLGRKGHIKLEHPKKHPSSVPLTGEGNVNNRIRAPESRESSLIVPW